MAPDCGPCRCVTLCVDTCMNHNQAAELLLLLSRDLSVNEGGAKEERNPICVSLKNILSSSD